ncbi:MAG: dephospho-CoA kinase [Gammaproteobacteria bacterium]|nr:MAG: dephospho-CoA kinase [Gammaproteobacteria bacterium]
MLIIGLTGGYASGKSTAARRFAEHGVPVIDADAIAHELTQPGSPALRLIVEAFGPEVLDEEGRLRRALLRRRIFKDAKARRKLEAILHPLILQAIQRRLATIEAPYAIIVAPLLIESGWTRWVDRVLVIDAPGILQYERAQKRDRISTEDIEAIMSAQASRKERLAAAHEVIVNDNGLEKLYYQVDELHAYYMQLTQGRC